MKLVSIYRIISILTFAILCSNCSSSKKVTKNTETNNYVFYPLPPDTVRFQYLTSISSTNDLPNRKNSAFLTFLTGEKEAVKSISKPYGISSMPGKIFVSDVNGGVVIIDLVNSEFELFKSQGIGRLVSVLNTSADTNGNFYAADAKLRKVLIYSEQGAYLGEISRKESFVPTSVVVKYNKIWICNKKSHQVEVYDLIKRKLLYSFPNVDAGDNAFLYQPLNMYVENNKVYVSDIGGFNVKVFTLDGEYIRTIGMEGMSFGQFARNKGVAADRDGNVLAVDAVFENIQIFSSEGEFLLPFANNRESGNVLAPAGITIDYDNMKYFHSYVHPDYQLKYLVLVTCMYGPNKINIYGRVELNK